MKPYRVALIGCSASKLSRTASARELYSGALFKLALQYAEIVAEQVFILSAVHDVLRPETLTAPYDQKLTAKNSKDWGRRAGRRLVDLLHDVPLDRVVFLAGEAYFAPLDVPERKLWERPLKGLGIGEQKQRLKELIDDASGRTAAKIILQLDERYPGKPDEPMEVTAKDWQRLVRAARAEAA